METLLTFVVAESSGSDENETIERFISAKNRENYATENRQISLNQEKKGEIIGKLNIQISR